MIFTKNFSKCIYIAVMLFLSIKCTEGNAQIAEVDIMGQWIAIERYEIPIDTNGPIKNVFVFYENHKLKSLYIKKGRIDKEGTGKWELSFENGLNILTIKFPNEKVKSEVYFEGDNLILRKLKDEKPLWKFERIESEIY